MKSVLSVYKITAAQDAKHEVYTCGETEYTLQQMFFSCMLGQMNNDRTLCFLVRGNSPTEVLLGLKKAGFGVGKYAGFGGKVEADETVEAAAVRELEEEAGIKISTSELCPIGRLTFLFPSKPNWDQIVHVFLVHEWTGDPQESDEMRPVWNKVDALPFEGMWDDAHYWLPLILQGKSIDARFVYNDDNETVGKAEINEWNGHSTR